MIGFGSHGWSSTGWETSFYGGYDRTLYDLADVKIPYEIKSYLSRSSKLGYYSGSKLLKVFLQRIYQFNLSSLFIKGSVIDKRKSWGGLGKEEKYLVISKEAIKETLEGVLCRESELKSLFEHFKEDIINSTFEFLLKNDDKVDPGSEVRSLLSDVKELKRTSYYGTISGIGDVPEPSFNIQRSYSPTVLSSEEQLYAKQIVEKLDITFDPDFDSIHSLKNGKLDVRKLCEAVAHNDHIYYRVEEDQKTKPFSVVILCDESGSMTSYSKLERQYELVKILHAAFSEIMPQDRISVYGHSGDDDPEIYVYQDKYNLCFAETIFNMKRRDNCENYDGPVVEAVHERVRSQTNDNILMIVISDGQPAGNHGYGGKEAMDELKRIIEKCKRDNFVIMGIGFAYDGVKEIYSYNTIVDDMSKVVEKTTTLLNKVVKTEFQ